MFSGRFIPRLAQAQLVEALQDSPVVLVHGPRQCGKTTLASVVAEQRGFACFTFDDEVVRGAAQEDPVGFVADLPHHAVLDEVQRVPGLFLALKAAVDRDRRPGRLILTGSSNVLLIPRLADSLAGRMAIIRLHPFAQAEMAGNGTAFLMALLAGNFKIRRCDRLGPDLARRIVEGGFPGSLEREKETRKSAWYRGYVQTLVQRDVRDLARISSLDILPRLLALAASQTARLLNVADLAAPFGLSRPTIRDYVTLLERVFLLEELPPWHGNRLSRLIKTPKLHMGDTGIAAMLLKMGSGTLSQNRAVLGQLLETFVYQELRRQAGGCGEDIAFYHFRDKDGYEVDIVLERGGELFGVEVKASATVTASDFRGLRKLALVAGERFAGGVVLYDGETSVGHGDGLFAVPIRLLWEL